MSKKDIIILVLVVIVVGFRLYQKYGKKGFPAGGSHTDTPKNQSDPSKDDGYEPYSKKQE